MGKIVVLGASPKPKRFSYKAIRGLLSKDYQVIGIGNRPGNIGDLDIITEKVPVEDVDIVMLYINATVQQNYYDYILGLKPREILFNPGTENPELARLALDHGIGIRYDCALVLMDTGML